MYLLTEIIFPIDVCEIPCVGEPICVLIYMVEMIVYWNLNACQKERK